VKRIRREHLADVVDHRTVIVPQLGASGVAGHTVRTQSGFRVQFGPIRARDLPLYFALAGEASLAMRQVRFGLKERLALVPVELVGVAPWIFLAGVVLFLLDLVVAPNVGFLAHLHNSWWGFIPYLGAIVIGTVLVSILLPWIPGRAFALKGWFLGLVWVAIYLMAIAPGSSWKQILFLSLILPPISAFLALSFTGSSTFTSLSGVRKEMRIAIPIILLSVTLSLLFLVITNFVSW
ncbi:MAG: acetyl-CoA synthase subunit gamma, partial [Coprothermobacterota bacterium]|nr:acetyl-CoA synthase subunit gamma [Coprothermobacterota bacterium]